MNKVIISEAFDALHEYNNKSKKKKIVKENTSVTTRVVAKRNPHKRLIEAYEDFDEFYDAVWQKMLNDGVEVVDDAIQGRMGTTWLRWNEDSDVVKLDETEAQDIVEKIFNTTQSIDDAIEALWDACTPSAEFNDDDEEDEEDETEADSNDFYWMICPYHPQGDELTLITGKEVKRGKAKCSVCDDYIDLSDPKVRVIKADPKELSDYTNWNIDQSVPFSQGPYYKFMELQGRLKSGDITESEILTLLKTAIKHRLPNTKNYVGRIKQLGYSVDMSDLKHPKVVKKTNESLRSPRTNISSRKRIPRRK